VLARLLGWFEVDGTKEHEQIKIAAAHVGTVMEYGQHLQDFIATTAKMWSVQREDEMDVEGKVGGSGNDEGSKDEDEGMEDVRGRRHDVLIFSRIPWIKRFSFLVLIFFDHRVFNLER
jgi:hypothetical protein